MDSPAAAPKVSFIVPLFNHLAETRSMVASLQASLPPGLAYEIILVDDFSTDGTRAWLAGLSDPRLKKVFHSRNQGYAKANNSGVQAAAGEIFGLLNNDLLFEPGWLEPMLNILESPGLNAGLVGNVQFRADDGALDHAGVVLSSEAKFEHIQVMPDDGRDHQRVLAVTGACMLMRKADFEELGGFDEGFVNGCEDIDLCFKMGKKGKSIYVALGSQIRHHVSLSRGRVSKQNELNSRYLFAKWRPEIKAELGGVWLGLLRSGRAAYERKVAGALASSFLSTPLVAARVLAESVLLREEARWERELDRVDPNNRLAGRCRVRGLRYASGNAYASTGREIEFVVTGVHSARNFFVCGRMPDRGGPGILDLTISVNEIQVQTFQIGRGGVNFNVGIVNPLLLRGVENSLRIRFGPQGSRRAGDGCDGAEILVSHIVLDDFVIDPCACILPT